MMIHSSKISEPSYRKTSNTRQVAFVFLPFILTTFLIASFSSGVAGSIALAVSFLTIILLVCSQNFLLGKLLFFAGVVRYLVIYADYFLLDSSLITKDAEFFVEQSSILSNSSAPFFSWAGETSTQFYVLVVSRLFRLFGSHQLVMQVLAASAFVGFLALAYKVGIALNFRPKEVVRSLYIFSFLPSTIFFTVAGLREPWILLLLAGLLLSYLQVLETRKFSFMSMFSLFFFSVCLLLFHKAFNLIVPLLIALGIFFIVFSRPKSQSKNSSSFLWLVSLFLIVYLVYANPQFQAQELQSVFQGNTFDLIDERTTSAESRTTGATYGGRLNTSSPLSLITSFPLLFINYLGAPFPWQVRNLGDIYGLFDAWLGLFFLFILAKNIMLKKNKNLTYVFLLLSFLIICAIHAAGTINYGTAMRHRVVSNWIVILLGWNLLKTVGPRIRQQYSVIE